jgi:hypothetical protein
MASVKPSNAFGMQRCPQTVAAIRHSGLLEEAERNGQVDPGVPAAVGISAKPLLNTW